jgi:signal transduction histidine kinase
LPRSRIILAFGFGGLLLLMAFAAIDSVRTLRQIQSRSDELRAEFLSRTRVLEEIRADLYLCGTYVRDFLMEPEPAREEGHRRRLLEVRSDTESALGRFQRVMSRSQAMPFRNLNAELSGYWTVVEPVLQWSTEERRRHGYDFLRDQVFPRRTAMLADADAISGKARMADAVASFRSRLIFTIGLTIGVGLLLAVFTMSTVLRLESARGELRRLSARLVESQEEERRALARELHEEVGQSLSGALVEVANLSGAMRAHDAESMECRVGEIRKLVEESVGALRNLALLLRPSMLDDLGLVPALEWQAREISKRTGMRVKVIADGISEDLPAQHNTCIFRVVQEALRNSVQHAAARIVKVTVRQQPGCILLHIQDDGKGFNTRRERGMGLLGMQERVNCLGGTFQVDSAPGRGAEVSVALPVSRGAGCQA